EHQRNIDKLSRPQTPVPVLKRAFQLEHPGRCVDSVVNERQPALCRTLRLSLGKGENFELSRGEVRSHPIQVCFRHGKGDVNRSDLVQLQQIGRIVRLHQITQIDHQYSGACVDGSNDICVL